MHSRIPVRYAQVALLFLASGFLAILGCSTETGSTGVISTGNAGRVNGKVLGISSTTIAARLIKINRGNDSLVDSMRTDTAGSFMFDKILAGEYRVEAWQEGKLQGKSEPFAVAQNLTENVLVILLKPVRFVLDLNSLGDVDSVFLDYPGNPAYKQNDVWSVQGLNGDSGTLYTRLRNTDGTVLWLSWGVHAIGSKLKISGVTSNPIIPRVISIDTTAFFLTPHTTALWSFDSVSSSGLVHDLSGHGCEIQLPPQAKLESSPHGKSLVGSSFASLTPATTVGSALPPSLRWGRTGMQTIEMRVRLDSFSLAGYFMLGSYVGPRIGMTGSGGIGVYIQAMPATGGSAIWYGGVSEPNVVPVGRWLDVAVEIDQRSNDYYLWIDGQPIVLYPYSTTRTNGLVVDSSMPFEVGASSWDSRIGPFRIDEVRISDTLVFGQGRATEPLISKTFPAIATGATSSGACGTCTTFGIGHPDPATNSGFLLIEPSIPASEAGQHSVLAVLSIVLSSPSETRDYVVHRLLKTQTEILNKGSLPVAGVDYEETPFAGGSIRTGSSTLLLDVSRAAQAWLDSPPEAHKGLLLKARDESLPAIFVNTSAAAQSRPTIEIHYR